MKSSFLLALILMVATVATAQSCSTDVLNTCTANTAANQASVCGPLVAAQGYAYFDCMCTYSGQLVDCYNRSGCTDPSMGMPSATAGQTSYCNTAKQLKPTSATSTSSTSTTVSSSTGGSTGSSTVKSSSSTSSSMGSTAKATAGIGNDAGKLASGALAAGAAAVLAVIV
ncbi:hypothetical protein BC828DRAFT_416203 [Blastocladiella britannica]|nr:hypothetical protein BC828DRAFT_416203 [Blastocladiella britannica]